MRTRPNSDPVTLADPRSDVPALRAFVAVARSGTVGRAAAALGRTQPSISARLQSLEQGWGTRLFRRVARGMALTPEGARMLPLAEAALHRLEELDRAAGLPLSAADQLRVGAGDALGRDLLPRALAALLRGRSNLDVRLVEGPRPRLLDALREGEIDLALIAMPAGEPNPDDGGDPSVDLQPLLRSEVCLLAGRDGPPAGRSIPLRRLAARRIVTLQPGSAFRRHLEAAFRRAGLPFRPAVEVGNLSLVRRFVAAGLGVAPVPAVAFAVRDRFRGAITHPLAGIPPLTYARAVRSGVPLTAPARELLEHLA